MASSVSRKNNSTTEQKLVRVPVRVNPETIEENGQTGHIRYVKIGSRKFPCIIVEVPEDYAKEHMRMLWAEVKAEDREARCLIPTEDGGYIMCPECNRCGNCRMAGRLSFDNGHPASLEQMSEETGFEPAGAEATDDQPWMYDEVFLMLFDRLDKIKPKFAQIFREMYQGNMRPAAIAKAIGVGKSQVYADKERVRELAQELYREIMGQ